MVNIKVTPLNLVIHEVNDKNNDKNNLLAFSAI